MYIQNMAIILIVMYNNVVTAIDKIHTYLLRFNSDWALRSGADRKYAGEQLPDPHFL